MNRPGSSLRLTFRHEVRPDVYIGWAWATFWVAVLVWAGVFSYKDGVFDLSCIVPVPLGTWHSHDPAGGLYIETWATILVDSMQAGFGIWGVVLILSGLYRAVTTQKAFISCFSLGGAFLGFAWFLPSWARPLLKMVADHYPFLTM